MSAPVTAPVATFTTTATTACQDSCITFTNTTTGTLDSVRWRTIPTTSVVIASPTSTTSTGICFHAAGTYSVTLTAYNSAGSNTSTHVITVNPTPHPVIIKSGHTLSVSGTYLSYQWIQNITPITGATTNTYTYSAAAAYSVLVDSGGCRGFGILSTLGISGMNNNNDNYWLTHTDNDLNLFTTETLNESMNVTVFDATGRKILNDIWNAGSKVKQINSGFFPPGLYIIRLSNSNTSAVLRFIK